MRYTKKMLEENARQLRALWLKRAPENRKLMDVLLFYTEIEREKPELFRGMKHDPYQHLKTILREDITR